MDTPEKSTNVGAPISSFEDSPIFNFINSLSPVQPVKSVHGGQSFHSLNYTSISSVFTSPCVDSQKETKLPIRQPFLDSSKLETSSDSVLEGRSCLGIQNATKLSSCSALAQEESNDTCLLNEATVDPPDECSTQPRNLFQIHCDCGSPNHSITPPYGIKIDLKSNGGLAPAEVVPFVPHDVERRKILSATEIQLQEKNHQEGDEGAVAGCGWQYPISADSDEMLIFDSSNEPVTSKGQNENLGNKANDLTSSISRLVNVLDIPKDMRPAVSYGPCFQYATEYPILDNKGDVGKQHGVDSSTQLLSGTTQKQPVLSDQTQKIGNGNNTCISMDCKVDSRHLRGTRRRCLVFERSGVSGNNAAFKPSVSLPFIGKFTSDDRYLTASIRENSSSPHMLPGIGLHLNNLATISKGRMVTPETFSSGERIASMPCTISPFPPLTASKSLDREKDQFDVREVRDLVGVHDVSCEVPPLGVDEDLNHRSPKRKKRKSDNNGESEACKRCNCKKSKCLKLYCECFAAGVYCVDPCSCQGCFNKPIHEETVLATRKQIESRNPLAFAPKVVQASEPVQDMGEESNKTPASARHKRGCNCKKSSCLKKYCECYQAGVGCSASCRCERCKNAFGRKDAPEELEHVEDERGDCEKQRDEQDGGQQNAVVRLDEHPLADNTLPVTPCFSVHSPFLSIGYPSSQMLRKCDIPLSRLEIDNHFKNASEDDIPEILTNDPCPNTCVKTSSPNGKRVAPPRIGSPNRKGGRRLKLQSIPSFPSLNSSDHTLNYSSSYSFHPH